MTLFIAVVETSGCSIYFRVTRLGYFLSIGLLLAAYMIFWKDEVAQNNGDIWGYFMFKQIYYIFT